MRNTLVFTAALIALLSASPAFAVKVADITRLSGQRREALVGLGLVVGLNGTGDGGNYLPAIKPLASMLEKLHNPATVKDLSNSKNVAVVLLSAKIPRDGVHAGDQLDVYAMTMGSASSLKGGRLFVSPLGPPVPNPPVLALAEGAVQIEDPATPTVGVIKAGATMEDNWSTSSIDDKGRFELIIEDPSASWTTASNIAKIINDAESQAGEILAVATDAKTVIVTIPPIELERPDSFISRVQRLPVPVLATEARVQINERTGTLIVTGDVEISPVVISHKGLTITTVDPTPVPTPRTPVVTNRDLVTLDPANQGGAKLQDLVTSLEQLKVPAEDRITIVKELYKTGKLHAKLIVE
jgi:flagellar P-ring protein precursor FlgI